MAFTPSDKYFGFEETESSNPEMKYKHELKGNKEATKLAPFYVAVKDRVDKPSLAYGLFYDISSSGELAADSDLKFTSNGGDLDYYFIMGPSIESVTAQWSKLTQRKPSAPITLSLNPSS